jgi:hypothetical protein
MRLASVSCSTARCARLPNLSDTGNIDMSTASIELARHGGAVHVIEAEADTHFCFALCPQYPIQTCSALVHTVHLLETRSSDILVPATEHGYFVAS